MMHNTSLGMESNTSQEQYSSKSSSEQTDRSDSEQTDDHVMNCMVSGGRFYECVFCRRGFTTAQALGGHMNIHRKDRAKTKRSSVVPSSSRKPDDEDYFKFRSYPSIPSNLQPQYYVAAPDQVPTYYQDYFAPSAIFGFKGPSYGQYSQNQRTFNLFGEDWNRNFSCIDDVQGKMEAGSEDNDLDLELRLGHYP